MTDITRIEPTHRLCGLGAYDGVAHRLEILP